MINITSHSLEAPPHEIPIWGLRLEVQGIINHYAEVFECSRDFITAAVYAIVSTICGKHIELFDGKYNNNPNHWICVVAPSGSNNKSPVGANLQRRRVYVEKPKHKSFPTCFIYEGENTSAEVAVCCRKIQQCGIDITASYDDWLKVGCALATIGESGRSLFHICSRQNAKYNAAKTDKMFTDLLRRNYQQVNIGTFFWMCKQYGITTKE